jgi:hypothetical protein
MNLSDADGYPRTAVIKLGWMFLAFLASSGLILLLLSIYLAAWIRDKGRSSLPLYGFVTSGAAFCVVVLVDQSPRFQSFGDSLSIVAVCVYILATFGLRSEITHHFKEQQNWNPEFNILWTLLFSSVYLNNCLSPDRIPEESRMTSLNLESAKASISAKIAE